MGFDLTSIRGLDRQPANPKRGMERIGTRHSRLSRSEFSSTNLEAVDQASLDRVSLRATTFTGVIHGQQKEETVGFRGPVKEPSRKHRNGFGQSAVKFF